jgi:putative ABC transport system ATP-binding protein
MEIRLEKVEKTFENKVILNNINYTFLPNKLIGITGKSGSGKTTLLNCIGLLESITKGQIFYNNNNVTKLSAKNRQKYYKKHIGFLFQNSGLVDSWTVNQNLDIGLAFIKASRKEKLQIKNDALKVVNLENMLNNKIYTLSGGEQQRVALARLLIKQTQVILCDEPSAALDEYNTEIVLNVLKSEAQKGKIVIVSSHDSFITKRCSELLEL